MSCYIEDGDSCTSFPAYNLGPKGSPGEILSSGWIDVPHSEWMEWEAFVMQGVGGTRIPSKQERSTSRLISAAIRSAEWALGGPERQER